MAIAKGGLKVAVNFTPQAQADNLVLSEDNFGGSGPAPDLDQMMQANDGGGAGTRIIGVTSASVDMVKANLTDYVNLANFATPISSTASILHGTVSLDNNGNVTFVPAGDLNFLNQGERYDAGTFTYILRMGNGAFSVTTSHITIVGTNDVPTAQADINAGNEDTLIAGSVATNDHDVDHGAVLTYAVVGTAPAGLTLNGDGTYVLNAGDAVYQHLAAGQTQVVTTSYTVTDEHGASASSTLTITVTGVNDVASISGDNAGSVTEDGTQTASGVLTVADVDDGQAHAQATSGDAAVGSYTVAADGSWTYTVNNAAIQHLGAGVHTSDSFTVTSADGTDTETVVVDIVGTNDDASITGEATGSVTEDGTQTASGTLIVSDVDDGETHTQAIDGAEGLYGSFSVDADGNWTYSVDNDAIQGLNGNDSVLDAFTVWSQDGTAHQDVVIRVNGADDAPPPPTSASVTVTPAGKTKDTHIALPENATNVTITVTAAGDFDWNQEGFDITGDIVAHFQGANEHNSTGNHGPETSDFMSFSVPVTLTGQSDNSVDFQVVFTPETNPHSSLSIMLDWDLA